MQAATSKIDTGCAEVFSDQDRSQDRAASLSLRQGPRQ
jgi:hypothetical protein